MVSIDLEQTLLEELGYTHSPGFSTSIPQEYRRPLPDINGVYAVRNVPIAYFSRLSEADPERLLALYKRVWNQSKAPLLYVVSPQAIRIYNTYAEPAKIPEELDQGDRLLQILSQLKDVEEARQRIRQQLAPKYDRLHLDTGAFWTTPDGQRIKREHRADHRLLRAMDQVRRHLIYENIPNEMAYALLGRSIFIRYLEDRGVLTSAVISQLTAQQANNYLDALTDLNTTYLLFESLSKRFNGDLFPVDDKERTRVRLKHLKLMGDFLRGTDLDTRQGAFWPYDFRYIPIELISGIYDTFLNTVTRRSAGTYYTPLSLVDFMLDEALPVETARPDMKILDPACGSGVFLVRAYQRLVNAWKQQKGKHPTSKQLGRLLKDSIFGVDIHPEAIRVAAFSLYLAMLDSMSEQEIKSLSFQFPSLKNDNLIVADFFSLEVDQKLDSMKFDRVVGNPPWSKLTDRAEEWLQSRDKSVGDKQIAQAFLMRAPDFCKADGELALLAPAKSTILVTSGTHQIFRQSFFQGNNVRAVVNFSAIRHELFAEAIHPTVGIFYQPGAPQSHARRVVYGVPKPSPLSQQLGAIILDATEIKYLDWEDLIEHPMWWKVAMWGTPRDAALIQRLLSLPTLKEQADKLGWKVAEGIQIDGGDEYPAPWLKGLPLIPTEKFQRYVLNMAACEPITAHVFHRPRVPEIVQGPLALIRHSPVERRCAAAFSNGPIAYLNKVSGVAGKLGHEPLLKWLVAYINSHLAQYYHFLTSTSWAVERGNIIHEEYERMPFLLPDEKDPRLKQILRHFDQIVAILQRDEPLAGPSREASIQRHEAAITELVFDLYELTLAERQLVHDMVEHGIEFFYWSQQKQRRLGKTMAVTPPDTDLLTTYAKTFSEVATSLLRYQGRALKATIYEDGAPLSVVGFELTSLSSAQEVHVIQDTDRLQEVLRHLDSKLLEQRTSTLYMRRHVHIYDGANLYLVRPSERRFWTRSQARVDADSIVAEWLSYSTTRGR